MNRRAQPETTSGDGASELGPESSRPSGPGGVRSDDQSMVLTGTLRREKTGAFSVVEKDMKKETVISKTVVHSGKNVRTTQSIEITAMKMEWMKTATTKKIVQH